MLRQSKKIRISERFFTLCLFWGGISSCVILTLVKVGIDTEMVFALKDIPVYAAALLVSRYWLTNMRTIWFALAIIFSAFLSFVNYVILNPDYPAPLNNIRQIIAPLILMLIFCRMPLDERAAARVEKKLCYFVILVLAFGVIEQVFQLWQHMNLTRYFSLKGIPTDEHGVSFMFYEPMFNYRERLTSSFLDPISAGHSFASIAIYFFYKKNRSLFENASLFCGLLGVLLTLSKGAALQLFLGLVLFNPAIFLLIRISSVALPFIVLSFINNKEGIAIHMSGFAHSIDNISFLGHGIGTAGNYTKMFAENLSQYSELGISDTYIGSIIGQVGILGLGIWSAIALLTIIVSAQGYTAAKNALRMFFSIALVSVLSENVMNVTSFLVPAIVIGLSMHKIGFSAPKVHYSNNMFKANTEGINS